MMKKVMMGAALTMLFAIAGITTSTAQTMKIGYFDLEQIISIMPGAEKIDSILQAFSRDSINTEYEFRVEEFNKNDSTLRADSAKIPAKLYQERKTKLFQEFYVLQNWQEYSQSMYQDKQQRLVAPFAQKAVAAFREVVKEGKYTHVFKSDVFYEAPDADDLIPLVAKKMNIKLPERPAGPGIN